jgi:antitoxin (DNA-binding transcriptional repressor) of toxin-antitoxin stability system
METVGIRELKNRLSRYVRQVEAGDVVIVTDRGRVVAELRPPGPGADRSGVDPGLLDLERRGLVRLRTQENDRTLYPPMPHVDLGDETIHDLIDWQRGDR